MSGLGMRPIIRAMRPTEAKAVARVLYEAAHHAYRDINWHHSEEGVVDWFTQTVTTSRWSHIYVAVLGGEICGVMCLEPAHVDQLFIARAWQGKGIGRVLLEVAKQAYPKGWDLFVFQKNKPAIAFYDAVGLRRGEEGVSKLEGEKDVKYYWEPDSN